ncbi:MAG TPA: hypothetical protein VL978_02915 [Puia sp.]|nr:hypothetical protein [Puia sp.]
MLFLFGVEDRAFFIPGNPQRVKLAYPSFDPVIFQTIVKGIRHKLDTGPTPNILFPDGRSRRELAFNFLLPEDSSAFQFSEPFEAVNPYGTPEIAVDEFSRLLLPEMEVKKEENRHNETFLLRRFTDQLANRNIAADFRLRKNHVVQIKGLKMNFELSWKNGIVHLIKPISFDLKGESDIQNKSAQYFGYLDLLTEHAKHNDLTFDLLVGKPQDEKLQSSYEDALYILDRAAAPKDIITEEKLPEYSEKTAEILHQKDL